MAGSPLTLAGGDDVADSRCRVHDGYRSGAMMALAAIPIAAFTAGFTSVGVAHDAAALAIRDVQERLVHFFLASPNTIDCVPSRTQLGNTRRLKFPMRSPLRKPL